MEYIFDQYSREASMSAIAEQLPRLIYNSVLSGAPPTIEDIFSSRCNDTPVVRSHIEEAVVTLRNEGEIDTVDEDGKTHRRATMHWGDRIKLAKAPSLFGRFNRLKLQDK